MACLPERFMIPSGKVSEHYYERINNNMFSCAKCKMPMSKEAAVERNERAKTENNASLKCALTKLCECPKDGEGDELGELLDAHEVWGEGTENAKEIEDEIKKYIEKAVAANEKLRGNIPQDIKESLDNILRSPYNWKSHLSRFIARSSEVIRIETRSKRNRRYGFKYPGYRNEEVLNLGLAIDTSGSVDMNMLTMIFAHLNQIRKTTPFVITIIECDCDVGAVYDMPKVLKNVNVTGRGGTAFTPAIKKAEELKLDALVYFTDGYGEHDLVKPKMPIIWAITPGGSEDRVKGKGQILKLPEPKA